MQHSSKLNRWQRSVEITKSSWQIFQLEPKLIIIEVISFVGVGLILGLFGALAWKLKLFGQPNFSPYRPQFIALVVALYACFSASYAILMGWFVHVIYQRLAGRPTSLAASWQAIAPKWHLLALYGAMNGVVSFSFSMLQDRLPFFGKIAAFLGQLAWVVANIFAIPIIAMSPRPVKPISAVKQSAGLVRKTWGESVVLQFGIGLVGLVIGLFYAVIFGGLFMAALSIPSKAGLALIVLGVVGWLVILITLSLLASIAQAVLFYYAKTGQAPEVFNRELLQAAMTPKKARKIFAR